MCDDSKSKSIEDALLLFDNVCKDVNDYVRNILDFGVVYHRESEELRIGLPYHINLIDELRVNENAHSRILCRMLRYQNVEGRFEYLEFLLKKMSKVVPAFGGIKLHEPTITQEKERIDLWVRDAGNCAIIFENKIYNASDRDAQISRYIEKTRKEGFRDDQIYVVYLSQSGREPSEQTWGAYKEQFAQRYINISFRKFIRQWLVEDILPHIRYKDQHLLYAATQYYDYLNGLFGDRDFEKNMIMKLQGYIKQKLNLDEHLSLKERILILSDNIHNLEDLKNQMENMKEGYRKEYRKEFFKKWQERTAQQYPSLNPNKGLARALDDKYKEWATEVKVRIGTKDYIVNIAYDGRLYCQVERCPGDSDDIRNSLVAKVLDDKILNDSKDWAIWKYFDANEDSSYDLVYDCFESTIKFLQDLNEKAD